MCWLILSVEKRWITVILNGLFTQNSVIIYSSVKTAHSDHFVNCFKQFTEKSDSKIVLKTVVHKSYGPLFYLWCFNY